VDPRALNIRGSTQPEVFRGTVDHMARAIQANPVRFWRRSFLNDGPFQIWEINGERYLYNGNHRYHAAIQAGAEIPDDMIRYDDMTGSAILTFPLDQLDWLPGMK
jgi:hypothetical protein